MAGLMLVMLPVACRVASTSFVVSMRVSRKAFGANFMNQSLYISTDSAMSAFQFCGLSRLTGIVAGRLASVLIDAPHVLEHFSQRQLPPRSFDFHLRREVGREA